MSNQIVEILLKAPLFRGIQEEKIEELITIAQYQVRSYEKKQLIAQAGDRCDQLMIIIEGKVAAEMLDFSGKSLKIEDAEAPQSLASAFLFTDNPRIPVYVTAITDCKFLYIPKKRFQHILMRSEALMENYIRIISQRAQFLSDKIKFMSFNTIRQKLANFLLEEMKEEDVEFSVGKSQRVIAELFGVARPSLARCIGELEDEGLIHQKMSRFNVLNKQALQNILLEG